MEEHIKLARFKTFKHESVRGRQRVYFLYLNCTGEGKRFVICKNLGFIV